MFLSFRIFNVQNESKVSNKFVKSLERNQMTNEGAGFIESVQISTIKQGYFENDLNCIY